MLLPVLLLCFNLLKFNIKRIKRTNAVAAKLYYLPMAKLRCPACLKMGVPGKDYLSDLRQLKSLGGLNFCDQDSTHDTD